MFPVLGFSEQKKDNDAAIKLPASHQGRFCALCVIVWTSSAFLVYQELSSSSLRSFLSWRSVEITIPCNDFLDVSSKEK